MNIPAKFKYTENDEWIEVEFPIGMSVYDFRTGESLLIE